MVDHKWVNEDISIPEISDDELQRRQKMVSPLIYNDDELFTIKEVDPRGIAFTWEPELIEKVNGLKEIKTLRTHHSCGYYGIVKPSLAEVLAQIPNEYLSEADYFAIDLSETVFISKSGSGHILLTRLFKKI